MLSVDVKDLSPREVYYHMIGGIGPRPIALVSTISHDGINNVSPFSFFNGFGSNPPMIGFSPARRGRDGTLKDTYNNLMSTKECVVQVVTHSIVEQVSLSSTEYPSDVDEFLKSGFTALDSDLVKPKRVKESPFQMECKLHQMIDLGDQGGAGNLAICEILKFHISKDILDIDGHVDQTLIDLVGRNGGEYYTRSHGDALFTIPKPLRMIGMGVDELPDFMKMSDVYSGNNLAHFASLDKAPEKTEIEKFINEHSEIALKDANDKTTNLELSLEAFNRYKDSKDYKDMLHLVLASKDSNMDKTKLKILIEEAAKIALEKEDIDFAWKTALLVPHWL